MAHEGMRLATSQDWALIILDLRLPGPDGLEICRAVRRDRSYQPILMLTSKSSELDRVLGLETGADDYLTKPFSVLELAARVRAIFRRIESMQNRLGQKFNHGCRDQFRCIAYRLEVDVKSCWAGVKLI